MPLITSTVYHTYLLTELSPSWGAANCAAPQELQSILWNPKVQYHVHMSPPLVPTGLTYIHNKSKNYEAHCIIVSILLLLPLSYTCIFLSSLYSQAVCSMHMEQKSRIFGYLPILSLLTGSPRQSYNALVISHMPFTVVYGLRHEPSSFAQMLGSWDPIPFKAWMFVLCTFIQCLCRSVCR
jgi:hypothetical protein